MSTLLPVKERILKQIEKNILAMTEYDNNGVSFEFVTRYAQDTQTQHQGNAIAILDGNESFVYQTSYLSCTMQVGLEFTCKIKKGAVASTKLGQVFAALKKQLLSDPHLIEEGTSVQLCENVRVTDYLPTTPDANDDVAQAFAQFDFIYREEKENPYTLR